MNRTPLILVPGLISDDDVWGGQLAALGTGREVRVFRCGRQASIASMAEDLLRGAPDHFAVAGSSMGGYVALAATLQAPQRILGLALVATSARADDEIQHTARDEGISRARSGQFAQLIQDMAIAAAHPLPPDHPLVAHIVTMLGRCSPLDYISQQRAIASRPDQWARLPEIHCPTVIVSGAADCVVPCARSQELHDRLPGSTLHVIPDVGHAVTQAAPEIVTEVLLRWVAHTDPQT
ncbi:MAG: hypothetical protein BGO26_01660 [Actinobacteria bacterium 69-20]|nr:alpha/beta hydrolase [Actinomycetota bacterium]OJV29005.1 MAG: hypothetical protein BGO26_01660 [Actinobacteria bacterium 69-20]